MKTPLVLLTLLAGSILAVPAWAGTPASPEITDAAGDAPGSVDVTSLWITYDAATVTFNLKLADLAGGADPAFDDEGAWHNIHRIAYTLSSTGATYYAEVQISAIESQAAIGRQTPHTSATVTSNVGTQYSSGRNGTPGGAPPGTVAIDAANNLIKVTLTRDAALAAGTIISGLTVKTFQNSSPHEMENQVLTPIIGGGRVLKDSTATGRLLTLF